MRDVLCNKNFKSRLRVVWNGTILVDHAVGSVSDFRLWLPAHESVQENREQQVFVTNLEALAHTPPVRLLRLTIFLPVSFGAYSEKHCRIAGRIQNRLVLSAAGFSLFSGTFVLVSFPATIWPGWPSLHRHVNCSHETSKVAG